MSWDMRCQENLPPGEELCTPEHCARFRESSAMRRICLCLGPDGKRIPGCEPKTDAFPVATTECWNRVTGERRSISVDACEELRDRDRNWQVRTCYCCCYWSVAEPRVATGEEGGDERPAREVAPGDTVSAARARRVDGALRLSWAPAPVALSETTECGNDAPAVLLRWENGGELVLAADQPVLTPSGGLVPAGGLAAGDRLVDPRGRAVPLAAVEPVTGAVHHLATEPADGEGTDGHLLALNGVVVADHAVRLLRHHPRFAAAFAHG